MVIRVVLGFVLFWVLIYVHLQWSERYLAPVLGETEFAVTEALTAGIGPVPTDRYQVVFTFSRGYQMGGFDRNLIDRKLREGRIRSEIRVTGLFGREVLRHASSDVVKDWRYRRHSGDKLMLYGPAEFRALPLERYTVTARLSGENAFLEDREIVLALTAARGSGYGDWRHLLLYLASGALFVFIAGVWMVYRILVFFGGDAE